MAAEKKKIARTNALNICGVIKNQKKVTQNSRNDPSIKYTTANEYALISLSHSYDMSCEFCTG